MNKNIPAGIPHTKALAAAPKGPRFIVLDGLRGIGALLVVYGHYNIELWPGLDTFILYSNAYLVVDIFFLLSGFVLAHAFYDKPDFNAWEYTKKRAFRLWPLHLFTLAGCLAIMYYSGDPISEKGLLLNIALLHNIGVGSWVTNAFNYPSWSLSVELVANVAIALLFLAIPNRRWNTLSLAAISLTSGTLLFFNVEDLDVNALNLFGWLNTGLLRGFLSFPLGILAYRCFVANRAWFDRRSLLRTVCIGLMIAGLFASFLMGTPGRYEYLFVPFYAVAMMMFASPGLFWEKAMSRFRFLGSISFAMYVVHMMVLKVMAEFRIWPQDYILGLLIAWGLSFALATFAHFYVERATYDWLTKHWSNKPPGTSLPDIVRRKLARPAETLPAATTEKVRD